MKKVSIIIILLASFIAPCIGQGALSPSVEVLPGTTVEVGEEVYFSGTGTTYDDADLLKKARYEWDFGDGYYLRYDPVISTVTRQGIAAVHYYMTPGEYTATLSVKIFSAFNAAGDPNSGLAMGTTVGMGSDNTKVAYGAYKYTIGVDSYTLVADPVGIAPGSSTIPTGKYGAVGFDAGTDLVVHATEASDNATGYTTRALAIAGIPTVAASHMRIGTLTTIKNNGNFVLGTTTLDVADDSYVNPSFIPATGTLVGNSTFVYDVGGTLYTLASNAAGVLPGDDVIPQNKYGAIALDIGADGVVHVTEATANATGYASVATALAGIPAVAASHVRYGTVSVIKTDGAFTFGTTALNATNTTARYTPVESTPTTSGTHTETITVTGTAPMTGFEIQRANLNNRTKQYLYIQIPASYRGNTTQLKVSLIGTTSGTTVLTQKSSLAAEETLLFDQTSLGIDDYVLQAQLLDAAGTQLTGGIWRDKFSKTFSGEADVSIDENNSIRYNGALFFPMGPFMLNSGEFAKWKADAGINMSNTEGYAATHTADTWATYLGVADTNEVGLIGPGRGSYEVAPTPNRWKFNHNPDTMEDYVTHGKTSDAMFAWSWQDEPNMGGRAQKVYPPTLAAWAYVSHAGDPQHPEMSGYIGQDWSIYYGTAENDYDYIKSGPFFGGKKWMHDIFAFDIYPICLRMHPSVNMTAMGPYAAYLDALERAREHNKDLAPMLMAINPSNRDLVPYSVHSAEQVYFEAWVNVIHGVKGIVWFQYFDPPSIRWASMKKFADQMNVLAPVVLGPPASRTVTDTANVALNRVDTLVKESGGYLYIFAARVTEPDPIVGSLYTGVEPDSISVDFTISDATIADTATVVDENRGLTVTAGAFTDTFAKNAVHIYRIPYSGVDSTAPVISAFAIPSTASALSVSISSFACTDETSGVFYCLTETNDSSTCANWSATAPATYEFSTAGEKTLYPFCKDYSNNIGTRASDSVTITLADVTAPVVTAFVIPATAETTIIPVDVDVTTFTCTDAVGVTGYCLVTSDDSSGCVWAGSAPTLYSFLSFGTTTLYAFCQDAAGNISTSANDSISISPVYYDVTVSASEGCVGAGDTVVSVVGNTTYSTAVTPETGYEVAQVSGCGGTWNSSSTYTTGVITGDCTISVSCQETGAIPSAVGGTITLGSTGGTISFTAPPAAPTCSTSTDYLGTKDISGSPPSRAKNLAICQLYTPSCYGALNTGYVRHGGTGESSIKLCVYTDNGDLIPGSDDTRVGCSSGITTSVVEWASGAMDGGSFVSGNYWLCAFVNDDAANTFTSDTAAITSSLYYKTNSGWYDNPPTLLSTMNVVSGANMSMYVTIGE